MHRASFLESKILELMFNDSSERGSIVIKLSPTHCNRFNKNIINTEEHAKNKTN
jgi:hypothetical protein